MDINFTRHVNLDQQRQLKAREYSRKRRRLSFVDMGMASVGILLILTLGLDRWLRDLLQDAARQSPFLHWQPLPSWFPVQILVYALILIIVYQLATLPLS